LQKDDPAQEWVAAAVFRSRSVKPEKRTPYEDLIRPTGCVGFTWTTSRYLPIRP
jgi:hypothetical protein